MLTGALYMFTGNLRESGQDRHPHYRQEEVSGPISASPFDLLQPHPSELILACSLSFHQDLTVGQFVYVIRKRIKLAPEKAIFIFVDEVLPPTAQLMSAIYEEHKYVSLLCCCACLYS